MSSSRSDAAAVREHPSVGHQHAAAPPPPPWYMYSGEYLNGVPGVGHPSPQHAAVQPPPPPPLPYTEYLNVPGVDHLPAQHAAVQPAPAPLPYIMYDMEYVNIPGVRFSPTDEELITYYLRPKLHGEVYFLPPGIMHDANVYGEHPVDLVSRLGESTEGSWYVFSPRTRKYLNGRRPRRDTGEDGYWKAMGKNVDILDDEKRHAIGHKRALTYHVYVHDGGDDQAGATKKKKGGKKRDCRATEWKMVEFVSLDSDKPIAADAAATSSSEEDVMLLNNWVLCKITRKEEKKNKSLELELGIDDDDDNVAAGNPAEFTGEEVHAVVDPAAVPDPVLSTPLESPFDVVDSWFFNDDALHGSPDLS